MIKQTENLLEILKMKGIVATLGQRLKEAEEGELGYEDFLNGRQGKQPIERR